MHHRFEFDIVEFCVTFVCVAFFVYVHNVRYNHFVSSPKVFIRNPYLYSLCSDLIFDDLFFFCFFLLRNVESVAEYRSKVSV